MATIHRTTMTPTKLELLTAWLPRQPWYEGDAAEPRKAGGFRLDDPQGEVGIEFMVVDSGHGTYLVPMTYRAAPLAGADHALIGTSEHGVLGRRWIYDGVHDPVLVATLLAFLRGEVPAQAQSVSDTLDPSVHGHVTATDVAAVPAAVEVREVAGPADATEVRLTPGPLTLRVHRVLGTDRGPDPRTAVGHATAGWPGPDGTEIRDRFAVIHHG
jgi:hypothetical protein